MSSGSAYEGWHDPSCLRMGRHSYGQPTVLTYGQTRAVGVRVGSFCSIGAGVVFLLDGQHRLDFITTSPLLGLGLPLPALHGRGKGPIVVGDDVWIGRDSVILSGVRIGTGAVVAAGALVTKDVRPYAIVGGNPARELSRRFSDEDCERLLATRWWEWSDEQIRAAAEHLWSFDIDAFVAYSETVPRPARQPRAAGVRVSVVVVAAGGDGQLPDALESALAQDDVGGTVEVLVVEHGAGAAASSVLADYGDRIRSIRLESGDRAAAFERGIAEATGEYVAFLDAADVWPSDRLARHLATLDERPEVGLAYGDIEVVAAGDVVSPSWFDAEHVRPDEGVILGRLVLRNYIGRSAATFRRSALGAVGAISPDAPDPEWALHVAVAAVAEAALVPGVSCRCRASGLPGDVPGERLVRWYRRLIEELIDDPAITALDIQYLTFALREALDAADGGGVAGLDGDAIAPAVVSEAAQRAERLRSAAPEHGAGAPRSRALLRAFALDPDNSDTERDLHATVLAEQTTGNLPARRMSESLGTPSGRLLLAWVDDVLAEPQRLRGYVAATAAAAETLVIISPPEGDSEALVALVESDPLLRDGLRAVVIDEPVTHPAWNWLMSLSAGWWIEQTSPAGQG